MSASEAILLQATERLAPESRRRALGRVLRERTTLLGLVIVVTFTLAAVFAPLIARHDPNQTDFLNRFASPSRSHPFGTDQLGRDEFARMVYGGRLSLAMAVSAGAGITIVGIVLGLVAAFYARLAETLIMRAVDVLLALPLLIQALVVVVLLGQGLRNLIFTVILVQWPRYARIVRGMALKIREREFIEAGRAAGATRRRLVVRHVLPNLIGPVVVFSTVDLGQTLFTVSSLSFLGFGVAPPAPEWGALLSEARFQIERAPQLLLYPGFAITLTVLALNLMGDGLRDLLDPRTQALEQPTRRHFLRWKRPATPSGPRVEPPATPEALEQVAPDTTAAAPSGASARPAP